MATINWDEYLLWREQKNLDNDNVKIYINDQNLVIEVKSAVMNINGEDVVQVQLNGKANVLVPVSMVIYGE